MFQETKLLFEYVWKATVQMTFFFNDYFDFQKKLHLLEY